MNALQRARFEADLRAARAALDRRALPEARARLSAAHRAGQNDPLPHARVHLGLLRVEWAARRPIGVLNQTQLALLAPAGSLARRWRGLAPGEDDGIGILGTIRRAIRPDKNHAR